MKKTAMSGRALLAVAGGCFCETHSERWAEPMRIRLVDRAATRPSGRLRNGLIHHHDLLQD